MNLSAQAVYIANAVKRAQQGALHIVIADSKKEAYYIASDLDNFFCEENLFFFPATSEKSEYKKNTALLQRTSALSALTRWTSSVIPGSTGNLPSIDGSYLITPQLLQKNRLKPFSYFCIFASNALRTFARLLNSREAMLSRVSSTFSNRVISLS